MSELSNLIYDVARTFTWEQILTLLRKEYLPQLPEELRKRDERIIRLLDDDYKKAIVKYSK